MTKIETFSAVYIMLHLQQQQKVESIIHIAMSKNKQVFDILAIFYAQEVHKKTLSSRLLASSALNFSTNSF
jgi:hypothetical protein